MTAPVRVLMVEDSDADAYLIGETLEAGGLLVDIARVTDGRAARDYLLRGPGFPDAVQPDLILLDLNLPGMDGIGLLQEMRDNPNIKSVPVVVLTSSDAELDIARSYELGANCYVTKPVGLAAFQEIVHSVEKFWLTVAKLP